ncbi:cache domain-containing sensor histidine kinase [Cellulosilyticum sp. I15G10I2]|uniref:cache domain-containing sensor histidine kinase n=1 Tax=Cellulosilyticum sp. I15G10I2 TaxID=1892843 RepID=UPI001A9A391A|nr:sensor histidine kinase [Cellulosilyticum sp. I15G10I2]
MNRSLKFRMIFLYTLFSFFIIGVLSYFTYNYIVASLKNNEHVILQDSINYIEKQISFRIKNINQEFVDIFDNLAFQDLYIKSKNLNGSLADRLAVEIQYREYFNDIRLRNNDIVDSILMVMDHQKVFSDSHTPKLSYNAFQESIYHEYVMKNKNVIQYQAIGDTLKNICVLRSFYYTAEKSTGGTSLNPGYLSQNDQDYTTLMFYLKKNYLKQIIEKESEKRQTLIYIVSEEGEPIIESGSINESSFEDYRAVFMKNINEGEGFFETNKIGKSISVYYRTIEYANWKIIYVYDQNILYQKAGHVRVIASYIFIGAIFLVMLIASIISNSVVKPIRELGRSMDNALENQLTASFVPKYNDEIADLSKNFNVLLKRISELVENIRSVEKQKRRIELKALQAQINPHFLYNTLDTVYWLAMMDNHKHIADLISDLAGFFRLSLNKGQDITTVERELDHITKYIEIQKVRSNNSFDYHIEADPLVYSMRVPKLILQPLVENAIIHGFKSINYKGYIDIKVENKGEAICFQIEDNGIGLQREMIQQINSRNIKSEQNMGYAIGNVMERIVLYAGDQYGIQFDEEVSKGTRVLLTFPTQFSDGGGDRNHEDDHS